MVTAPISKESIVSGFPRDIVFFFFFFLQEKPGVHRQILANYTKHGGQDKSHNN